jgi:hypothetical protein
VHVLRAPAHATVDAEWELYDGTDTWSVVHPLGTIDEDNDVVVSLPAEVDTTAQVVSATLWLRALDEDGGQVVASVVGQRRLELTNGGATIAEPEPVDLVALANGQPLPDALQGQTATLVAVAPTVAVALPLPAPLDLSDKEVDVPGHVVRQGNVDLDDEEVLP